MSKAANQYPATLLKNDCPPPLFFSQFWKMFRNSHFERLLLVYGRIFYEFTETREDLMTPVSVLNS